MRGDGIYKGRRHCAPGRVTMKRIATVMVMAWCTASCAATNETLEEEPVKQSTAVSTPTPEADAAEVPVWSSAVQLTSVCEESLARAAALRQAIKIPVETRTVNNTLISFNEMMKALDSASSWASLMFNVHPDEEVRGAAQKCRQAASKFATDVSMDRGLYDAAASVDISGSDALTKRFVDKMLRDFRRAGVDKSADVRERLGAIQEELVALTQTFGKNVREDVKTLEVAPEKLTGLPKDFIEAHPVQANGHIALTTDYPDFYPVQRYVEDPKVREELYKLFMNRAYPANTEVLKKVLALRHEKANLLDHPTWASYNAEDKMAKDPKTIESFIADVAEIVRPRMKTDMKELLKRKKKDNRRARSIDVWDRFYYVSKVRAEKYDFDARSVRPYFPYKRVKTGILELYGELFGLRFEPLPDEPVWHESVEAYGMYDEGGERLLGRFYLDMHPREEKYKHAAMFPLQTGLEGGQMPIGTLICNFPDPLDGDGNALMEHSDVQTFFHEFGHLIHQLLAQRGGWVTLAGINVEWDFVEAPSQILEEWAWDPGVLARFAKHVTTNEPIPAALVAKMRAADEFGKGVHVMRQVFYTAFSYFMHAKDPEGIDLDRFTDSMYKSYNPYRRMKADHVYANFGHLMGYSSMYYTYQWSLVIAKDLFTRFKAKGMLDTETARAYRKAILEPGGTADAATLIEDFLGRPFNTTAYKAWLED
jgi:thimet oligopeptidase